MKRKYSGLFLVCVVVLGGSSTAFAALPKEASQLQASIVQTRKEIEKIEEEVTVYRQEVEELGSARRTLEGELQKLDAYHTKLAKDVDLAQSRIELANLEVESLTHTIGGTERRIIENRSAIAAGLRRIHEQSSYSIFEQLFAEGKFSDFWNSASRLVLLQEHLHGLTTELEELKKELTHDKQESLAYQEELVALRNTYDDKRRIVAQNKNLQAQLVSSTKNKEETFQELIIAKEKLKKAFEEELFQYESRLRFVLDPQALPAKGSAPLAWPLDRVFVTQRFGKTVSSEQLYTSGSHSGTDFRANGDPVYAMADGVVVGVGDTDTACQGASFGKWVLIKYDNNLASTYGHLSLIKATSGQRVRAGDLVAYSGNTGRSTGPHLHVTVYAGVDAEGNFPVEVKGKESLACKGKILIQPRAPRTAYLNPLDYLPALQAGQFKHQEIDNH